jgi:hypothetical protein
MWKGCEIISKSYILASLLSIFFVSACVGPNQNTESMAINSCVSLCAMAKSSGMDLSNGPCLSDNNPEWAIDDWVCDVAHWPRQSIDNLPENQCKAFREGRAHHFVEVNENCKFIRAY